jgi:hypothetical protein
MAVSTQRDGARIMATDEPRETDAEASALGNERGAVEASEAAMVDVPTPSIDASQAADEIEPRPLAAPIDPSAEARSDNRQAEFAIEPVLARALRRFGGVAQSSPQLPSANADLAERFGELPVIPPAAAPAARDLVARPTDPPAVPIRLPLTEDGPRPMPELLSAPADAAQADREVPVSTVPASLGRTIEFFPPPAGGQSPPGAEKLVIEVEVTLANAEQVCQIATQRSYPEFTRLAAAAVRRTRDDFRQFRDEFRVIFGR